MSETVSEHQVRVYEYAKVRLGRWFTIQELSTDANIPDASAKSHAVRFEEMGIFDRLKASPAHLFRLSEYAGTRDPKTVKRLDAAIPVFAERRHDRLQRELHALGMRHRIDHHPAIQPALPMIEATGVGASMVAAPSASSSAAHSSVAIGGASASVSVLERPSNTDVNSPSASGVGVSTAIQPTEAARTQPNVGRGGKVDLLLSMVAREEGASLEELVAALGNLAHSIRASISVESRKRGIKIECVNSRYYLRSAA